MSNYRIQPYEMHKVVSNTTLVISDLMLVYDSLLFICFHIRWRKEGEREGKKDRLLFEKFQHLNYQELNTFTVNLASIFVSKIQGSIQMAHGYQSI